MKKGSRAGAVVLFLFVFGGFASATPPNVVMIISDDQAWTDFGFMGHEVIQTPHLDRLASESALFTHGYVPSSLCRPSLATMITGLYPHQHGITGNDPALPAGASIWSAREDPKFLELCELVISRIESVPTLPRLLAPKGYLSLQTGKWWEGNYSRGGFTDGMTHGDPDRRGRHGDDGLEIGRNGMKRIFDFVDEAAGRPFFLWYAPFLPHTPHNPPERLLSKYRRAGRPIELARYYAMCEWFDETCGQLLGFLDQRGLGSNTLIVFVTDNGWIQRTPQTRVPPGWAFHFAPGSKRSPNDGGVRTPIMVRWPGKIKSGSYDTLVSSIDLAPTILAAVGVEAPDGLPGINLIEVARNEGASQRKAIFGEIFAHDIADVRKPTMSLEYRWCVQRRWKAILPVDPNAPAALYDLSLDPRERDNLWSKHESTAASLRDAVERWWTPVAR